MSAGADTDRGTLVVINRREVLAGGGFALGLLALPATARAFSAMPGEGQARDRPAQLGAWVQVTAKGEVIIVTPGAEMGQGVATSLPKIVAEEMDADWSRVSIRLSEANPAFALPRGQRSANSDAVTSYYAPLRQAGATARATLVAAAAQAWNVDPAGIKVSAGRLSHPDGRRSLDFGEVAERAAMMPVPARVKLKDPATFTLIGRSVQRKDIPEKVMGTAVFGIDVELPGMVHAAIRHVPVAGARLKPVAVGPAEGMPGVIRVVQFDNAVAVVARSYWQARQAVDRLELKAEPGPLLGQEELSGRIVAGLDQTKDVFPFPVAFEAGKADMGATYGEIDAAMAAAAVKVEADFEVPYLAHATMEPLCCTALIEPNRCEIWAPVQSADKIPPEVAEITKLPVEAIRVNRTYIGGGFGRKNERDFLLQSVRIAMAVPGRPVKMIWSREEDMRNDYYRPGFAARIRLGADADGTIRAWHGRISGQPLSVGKEWRNPEYADFTVAGGLINPLYAADRKLIDAVEVPGPLRTGYWRSVSGSQNGFFCEAAVNELAAALKMDPIALRKRSLAGDPRSLAVLDTVARESGWTRRLPRGQGRGIAIATEWGSRCAHVVEVAVTGREVTVKRVVSAFDCGQQIEPDTIVAQIEGAIIFGLSAALHGKITLDAGAVVQSNFSDYRMVTLASAPVVEVHLLASEAPAGGVGEAGVPPIAPALAAAIFDATGKHVRRLPITDAGFEVNA